MENRWIRCTDIYGEITDIYGEMVLIRADQIVAIHQNGCVTTKQGWCVKVESSWADTMDMLYDNYSMDGEKGIIDGADC